MQYLQNNHTLQSHEVISVIYPSDILFHVSSDYAETLSLSISLTTPLCTITKATVLFSPQSSHVHRLSLRNRTKHLELTPQPLVSVLSARNIGDTAS